VSSSLQTFRAHWQEFLIEAWGMAVLLLVSGLITALIEPRFRTSWPAYARRLVEGLVIASTVVSLVYSPWGRRSGAHFNPAVTITFWWLGKVQAWDAFFYTVFQVVGAISGIFLAGLIIGGALRAPPVMWIVTQPGAAGIAVAFCAEFTIAFILMITILWVGGRPRIMNCTGLFAGTFVFLCICFEAPLSGFSMNPARSVASAAAALSWNGLWIYLTAPTTGMLAAAFLARSLKSVPMMACAKLVHDRSTQCIHCGFMPTGQFHVK
jgi:aquaporin Z